MVFPWDLHRRLPWGFHQTRGDYSTSVIDYDYIESNHDYICLEKSSERKQTHLHGLMKVYFQTTCDMNKCVTIGKPEWQVHKLHTVAASHNKDHMPWLLCCCLFEPRIYGCYSSRTFRSWWNAHSMQRQWSGCNKCNKRNYQSVGIKHRKKNHINCLLRCLCSQQTSGVELKVWARVGKTAERPSGYCRVC